MCFPNKNNEEGDCYGSLGHNPPPVSLTNYSNGFLPLRIHEKVFLNRHFKFPFLSTFFIVEPIWNWKSDTEGKGRADKAGTLSN